MFSVFCLVLWYQDQSCLASFYLPPVLQERLLSVASFSLHPVLPERLFSLASFLPTVLQERLDTQTGIAAYSRDPYAGTFVHF